MEPLFFKTEKCRYLVSCPQGDEGADEIVTLDFHQDTRFYSAVFCGLVIALYIKSAILRKRGEFSASEREVTIHAAEEALVIRYLFFRVTGASVRSAEIVPLRLAVLSRDVSGDLLLVEMEIILICDGRVRLFDIPTDFLDRYSVAVPKRHERAAGQVPTDPPFKH